MPRLEGQGQAKTSEMNLGTTFNGNLNWNVILLLTFFPLYSLKRQKHFLYNI